MDHFDGQVREYKGQVESKELETRKTIYEAVNPQCNHRCYHHYFDFFVMINAEVSEYDHSQENVHKSESDFEVISIQSSGDSGWMDGW